MIRVNKDIFIDDDEILFDFVRSSGPGGQNVNKVATAAQLRFNIVESNNLPDKVKNRMIKIAGKRVNSEGTLIIESKKYRSQERNKAEAIQRFIDLILSAAAEKKKRIKTKPTTVSTEKRINSKKQRSEVKKLRKKIKKVDGEGEL